MADYEAKYRLTAAPTATTNGGGYVAHSIQGVARLSGTSDPFELVPGFERVIYIPGGDLDSVLNMTTNAQKVAAYKQLLLKYGLVTPEIPTLFWAEEGIARAAAANALSADVAARADAYITALAGTYPVDFAL